MKKQNKKIIKKKVVESSNSNLNNKNEDGAGLSRQSNLIDNSEKNDFESEEELLKRKISEYSGKKTYISSAFQNNSQIQNSVGRRSDSPQVLSMTNQSMDLPPLPKKDNMVKDTSNSPTNVRLPLDSQGVGRGKQNVLDYKQENIAIN